MLDSVKNVLQDNIEQAIRQIRGLSALESSLNQAASVVCDCLREGHKILTCGNGGSAAHAGHLATEFVGRFRQERRPYPVICLNDSGSTLSAIGNDYAFEEIFARQVHAFGCRGDVIIAFSTSGQSGNVRAALTEARDLDLRRIAFLGHNGGACRNLATVELVVDGQNSQRIQEAHQLLSHTLCQMVEQELSAS